MKRCSMEKQNKKYEIPKKKKKKREPPSSKLLCDLFYLATQSFSYIFCRIHLSLLQGKYVVLKNLQTQGNITKTINHLKSQLYK